MLVEPSDELIVFVLTTAYNRIARARYVLGTQKCVMGSTQQQSRLAIATACKDLIDLIYPITSGGTCSLNNEVCRSQRLNKLQVYRLLGW